MILVDLVGRHLEFQCIRAVRKNGNLIFFKLRVPSIDIRRNFAFNRKKKHEALFSDISPSTISLCGFGEHV